MRDSGGISIDHPSIIRHPRRPLATGTGLLARLWLLLLLAVSLPVAALDTGKPFRDYVTDTWGVDQGLPQISVLAITQDPAGYLWFGTQTGLARFDGVRFVRYTQRDAPELGNNILALLADDDDRLWIGTAQGLLLLEDQRFHTIAPTVADHPAPASALLKVDGRILAGCAEGICTPREGKLQRLQALPDPALSLLARGDGLWAGGQGRVFHIAGGKVRTLPLPAAAGTAAVTALVHADGDLWAGTRNGLFRLRNGSWQAADPHPDDVLTVEAMHADREGNLWVATPQYLERLRPGQPPERIHNTPGAIAVRAIFEDRDGNLWLGSMVEGVTRAWNGWTRRLSQADGLQDPLLWSVAAAPDGGIWVGSSNGVAVWRQGRFTSRVAGNRLPHPEAYSLLPERDQTWIGTRAGVAVLRGERLEQPAELAPLRDAQINGIVRDRAGRLWFATTQGLFLLEDGKQLTRYGEREGLADARIRLVYETRDGRILLGTYKGLYEWRDGRILATGRLGGLSDETPVTAFLELGDGRWVLGTSNGESLRVHDGHGWHWLDRERELPANVAFHLAQNGNDLWVAGMRGVYRLPLASLDRALANPRQPLAAQIVINSGTDRTGGQQDKCCNGAGNSRGVLREGRLWLPTRDGTLLVDVDTDTDSAPRNIRIDHVQVQGRRLATGHGTLKLPLDARDLRFEFSLPDFQPMHAPQLRYRLAGYEKDWHELDNPTLRSASYASLPPGYYTFEVADFSQAEPLRNAAHVAVEIPRRLYETLAFRLLAMLGLAGLIWLGYLGLQHRYARQRAQLERLVQERTRDLQAANAKLKAISFTDPLTGLHNRRYLTQQIPTDLSFYERDEGYANGSEAVVFALLDVDHFKSINDTHGHAAGDRVLEQMGQLLGELKRSGDYVARWGGEEFLLVFRPLPRGSLGRLGQRLCTRIAAHSFDLGNGQQHRLTASVGLIECPLFPSRPRLLGWEQLVTLADRALYRAKTAGRNGWIAYQPAPGAQPPDDLSVAAGDPWWLVENGVLEMFGIDGRIDVGAPP